MNALQQRVKIQTCAAADDDLAIQRKFVRWQGKQSGNNLRKITAQRLAGLRLQYDFVALPKSETAEAIPFGLIEPAGFARQVLNRLGFRRRVRRGCGGVDGWVKKRERSSHH